ncbi:MAG: hypothetical protein AAF696_36345 [Bacteroidota bacterium]
MQALVKITLGFIFMWMIQFPAAYSAGRISPGPAAKQIQTEISTLLAAAQRPVKQEAATMQTPTQTIAQSKTTSLQTHTKTHPAAIILLVMAIAGVFLFPALVERCQPGWVERFSTPLKG